jgi:phosphate transport system substrate-binding protein
MYTNGSPKGLVKEFIDFILSPEGQKLVEEEGFVALSGKQK